MIRTIQLTILPGDHIGHEVMDQALRVLDFIEKHDDVTFEITRHDIGGTSYDKHGTPLTDQAIEDAAKSDACLLGAVGGPEWDNVPYDLRPEAGLLKIRKELGLYANLRPAQVFPALAEASSLKTELVTGLDILIVRELTGGIYFGEPRGREELSDGQSRAFDTQVYTTSEIERIARIAFETARKRNGRLTSVDKANVMASGKLWREVVTNLHQREFSDITLDHMFVDNCAMQLVRTPKQFDVIVTDNLFGDILSDEASMLTGSLGMLPSASLGDHGRALYEPVHGSAPDISGQGKANPLAMILSLAMACRLSLGLEDWADRIETAVATILKDGHRTADISKADDAVLSTPKITDILLETLKGEL